MPANYIQDYILLQTSLMFQFLYYSYRNSTPTRLKKKKTVNVYAQKFCVMSLTVFVMSGFPLLVLDIVHVPVKDIHQFHFSLV